MKILNKIHINHFFVILIFFSSFFSFNYNFLKVVKDSKFLTHSLFSEHMVVDGLINGKDIKGKIFLGRFTEDNDFFSHKNNQQVLKLRFDNETKLKNIKNNLNGEFKKYYSQYGLQVEFFYLLKLIGIEDVNVYKSVSSLLMSIVVALLYFIISKKFSNKTAIIVSLSLITSPLIVSLARNIYWLEFLWFLPILAGLMLGEKNYDTILLKCKFFLIFFLLFLIKMLCGYEYISTIVISSIIPFLIYISWDRKGFKQFINKSILVFLSSIFALIFSLVLQFYKFSDKQVSLKQNLNYMYQVIKIRTVFQDNQSKEEFCRRRQDLNKKEFNFEKFNDCIRNIDKSDKINFLKVFIRYLMFNDFLPWVGNFSNFNENLESPEKSKDWLILKTIWQDINLKNLKKLYDIENQTKIDLLIIIINSMFFVSFVIYSFYKCSFRYKLVIFLSFLAKLSWIVLAYGHSSIHFTQNYVLWYLPLIPFCLIALNYKNFKEIN